MTAHPHPFSHLNFSSPQRALAFAHWLEGLAEFALVHASIAPASSDASFRRYLRVDAAGGKSLIIMDAPPDKEDSKPFVDIARRLLDAGVQVPQLLNLHLEHGFLLLGDLGHSTFLQRLAALPTESTALYRNALQTLIDVQRTDTTGMPHYDHARLMAEMQLLPQWYLERHLNYVPNAAEQALLQTSFERICTRNLAEARVFVHRDFHSRNLMAPLSESARLGVLDFQDAVLGPISYDLASLLRDAYHELEEAVQIDLAARYWEAARAAHLPVPAAFDAFYEDFEWMSLQRALKVLGIFARLYHRDGKDGYLKDIPLVAANALRVCQRYDALRPLGALLVKVHGIAQPQVASFSPG